jgi:hypothetical protein
MAIGMATAVHPNLGGLAMLAVLPAIVVGGSWYRQGVRYLFGVGVVAFIPLIVLAGKLDSGVVSPDEQYDLVVRVRNPHHQLYETFPAMEYVQTVSWLAVLLISLFVLQRERVARQVAAIAAAIVAISALGALASIGGHPRILVMAQTARITPLLLVLGATTAAAAMCRLRYELAAPLLFTALVIAVESGVQAQAGVSTAAALAVLGALGITALATQLTRPSLARAAPIAIALALGAVVAVFASHTRSAGAVTPHDRAWRDVAAVAMRSSQPRDLFLVPPDQDGFRFLAHRPIVVDFGSFPFGVGLAEWRDRLIAVTGTRRVVDPSLGGAARRVRFMAHAYDATVLRSPASVCRFGVRYVVARDSKDPPWLRSLYRNAEFTLYAVRPNTCRTLPG